MDAQSEDAGRAVPGREDRLDAAVDGFDRGREVGEEFLSGLRQGHAAVVRLSRRTPNCSSSNLTVWLSHGADICRCSAARVKL